MEEKLLKWLIIGVPRLVLGGSKLTVEDGMIHTIWLILYDSYSMSHALFLTRKKVQRLLSIVDERNELVQLIEEQKDTDQMNSRAEMSADMSASSIPDISSSDISSSEISDFN